MMTSLILAILLGQERLPEPEPAAAKEAQKVVRDLFKEDYAKKSPADQKALGQRLYGKAMESKGDARSLYALLLESRDVAVGCADLETTIQATNELARSFAIDGPVLKLAALAKIAAAAKDPETARGCARALLAVVPEAIRAENLDAAAGAAQKAEALAKIAQDNPLLARAGDVKTDVASIKSEAGRVKPLLEKPGSSDAEAIGRYLCLIKGDWDAGLPHLLAGAKAPLKGVAEKDVLKPVDTEKQLEVAEGWIEIAQKEKSAWRKAALHARARFWLEQAAQGATGLIKMRVDKRLAETGDAEPGIVNLLRMIDPKQDAIEGEWTLDGAVLVSPPVPWARIQIPYTPPDEYDLTVTVERKEGDNCVGIGLVHGGTFAVFIDGFPELGGKTGLDLLDGVVFDKSPAAVKGLILKNNVPSTVVIAVRKTGVTVTVDSKIIVNWQGNYRQLTPSPVWKPRDPKMLLVGAFGSRTLFSKISVVTISGQGKRLR
jgi:hypothetical protein